MPPADPAPAPEWAVEMALAYTWGPRKARHVVEPDGVSLSLARLLATLRERTLREAADNLRALAPNSAGYGRKEWDDFNFDLPCADAIDVALKIGEDAILSLIAQPPKEA